MAVRGDLSAPRIRRGAQLPTVPRHEPLSLRHQGLAKSFDAPPRRVGPLFDGVRIRHAVASLRRRRQSHERSDNSGATPARCRRCPPHTSNERDARSELDRDSENLLTGINVASSSSAAFGPNSYRLQESDRRRSGNFAWRDTCHAQRMRTLQAGLVFTRIRLET